MIATSSALIRSFPPTTASPSRQVIAARDQPSSFFANRIDCLFTAANCSCVSPARGSSRSGSAIGFTLAARFWNRCPTSSTGDELVRFTPAHAAFYPVGPRGGPPQGRTLESAYSRPVAVLCPTTRRRTPSCRTSLDPDRIRP